MIGNLIFVKVRGTAWGRGGVKPPPPRRPAHFRHFRKNQNFYQSGTALLGHQQTMKMGHTILCVSSRAGHKTVSAA